MQDAVSDLSLRDEEGDIRPEFLHAVAAALDEGDGARARALTVDLHAGQIQGFFDVPVDELTAMNLIANHFVEKRLSNPVVVSPDLGNTKRCRNFAEYLNAPLAIIEKRRIGNQDKSEVLNLIGSVEGF